MFCVVFVTVHPKTESQRIDKHTSDILYIKDKAL